MSAFSIEDREFMSRAIQLAEQGRYTTSPNPRVGCVIVLNGIVVGEGYHLRAGEPHAEVHALRMAGARAKGATAYVTLEPCSHYGRTPPCAEGLINAGVVRVVAAMVDPNPQVAGRGLKMLTEAGISTQSGLLEAQAIALNPGFIKRMTQSLPRVTIKSAMSLDGRTAMKSGESQWITGPAARQYVQRLRAQSCAIITGIDSILHDDSALTVRELELGLDNAAQIAERQPLRVVLDSQLRIPSSAKILTQLGRTVIIYGQGNAEKVMRLQQEGVELLQLPLKNNRIDLVAVLEYLATQQCNEVLVETGATLAGSFIDAALADELVVFMAMKLLGSTARPLFELPLSQMSQQIPLQLVSSTVVGNDLCLRLQPEYSKVH